MCQEVERIIRSYPPTYFNNDKNKLYLLTKVKQNLYRNNRELLYPCPDQESFLDKHNDQLTKLVALKYVDIRLFHEVKNINDAIIKSGRTRAKFTKFILYQHE